MKKGRWQLVVLPDWVSALTFHQCSDTVGRIQKDIRPIKHTSSMYPQRFSTEQDRHPFNGLFSRATWVSRHQKGSTNVNFNEARHDGVAVASGGPYANHLHLTSDK